MLQKRKVDNGHGIADDAAVDTSRPSAIFKPSKGRTHTCSLALPGSIIAKYVQSASAWAGPRQEHRDFLTALSRRRY